MLHDLKILEQLSNFKQQWSRIWFLKLGNWLPNLKSAKHFKKFKTK